MRLHQHCLVLIALVIVSLASLNGCGGGGSGAPEAPNFASTPITAAVEGSMYSYTLAATAPSGGAVNFLLVAAPEGASLSGSNITWTPTSAESRVVNKFTATATTNHGGTSTQSWTVTPNGTVRVSWVNTYWGPSGPTDSTFELPIPSTVLIPQTDGSYQTVTGTTGSDGVSSFANIPAGYFWLSLAPRAIFWTGSSSFDLGADFLGSPAKATTQPATTTFDIKMDGLDATVAPSFVQFLTFPDTFGIPMIAATGSTTANWASIVNSNVDYSQIHTAYVMQDEPALLGSLQGHVLAASLLMNNLVLADGVTNTINGTLSPSPRTSLPLKINGSAWAKLFDNTAPTTTTPVSSPFGLSVQPFIIGRIASAGQLAQLSPRVQASLFWPDSVGSEIIVAPVGCDCSHGLAGSSDGFLPLPSPPLISTDMNLGTIEYGDPFPATWPRVFSFCQKAPVTLPSLDSSSLTYIYNLANRQSIALPGAPITPLISPVLNPAINGASLFTAVTLNSKTLKLSWNKPTIGTPYGYSVEVIGAVKSQSIGGTNTTEYSSFATLGTAQTSVTIPPDFFIAGNTYYFAITALADGRANMETSPNRSSLPTGSADVISAPITIGASAQ